jgi:hypothetical protein
MSESTVSTPVWLYLGSRRSRRTRPVASSP